MARLSMSAAALKRYEDPAEREKTSASQRGKTISPEHLARLLEAKAAWLATPESHEILRQNAIKQFRDPEMRYKAGNGSRGRKQTPGEIAKRVESAKITMATPEYKAKASAARKGQKRTQETKTRMSVSQRKRLENPELRARVAENTRQQWARAKAEGKTTLGQQADQGQLRLFD